jgi:sarcosine oxidase
LAVENEAALRACGAAVERLTPDELQDRFHYIHPPAAEVPIVYSPDTGFVRAEQAWKAFAASAVKHGAELRENTVVKAVEPRRGKVAIRTEAGDVRAGTAVVTAGAWARPLLAEAGIDLEVRPTRETIAYFHLPHERPPAIVEWGDPTIYALAAPGHGLKIGQHIAGPEADPDEEGSPDRESVKVLMDWVLHRFPSAAHAPHLLETCFYTNTSDEHFVLERHGSVVVGSPCSGHGFKFAPLIGERLADLVQG